MSMGEPARMPMRRIAIMDVKERSLSEGEQKARGNSNVDRASHSLPIVA
jgi:hypothetical protein